jgi:hypothetical protein
MDQAVTAPPTTAPVVPATVEALLCARRLGAELSLITSSLLSQDPERTRMVVERLIAEALAAARAAGLADLHEAAAADVHVAPAARRCVLAGLMVSLSLGRPAGATTTSTTSSGGDPILLGA